MKKNILICGYPNTVLRIFIDVLKDHYTVYFLSYSKKAQFEEIKKILGGKVFLIDTENETLNKKLYSIFRLFYLSFHIASDKNTQLLVAYHNHSIKNGLIMILLKLCFHRITRVHFPYDIYMYQFPKELKYRYYSEKQSRIKSNIHSWLALHFDKLCFEYAHKIITKGFKDELINLEPQYRIHAKPHFVFNFLIEKKDLVDKQIHRLQEDKIHIVSIGGISDAQTADNNYKVFEELLKEKNILLHVYSHSSEILKPLTVNKNLQIHPYITNHAELINEISHYDFGISASLPPRNDYLQAKMASGVRIYDFLTAGLPIIIDSNHTSMAQFITANNFGLIIPLNDFAHIKNYFDNSNYEALILSVKKNREPFIVDNHTDDILRFLEEKT
jgi:hypothetical protein